MGIWDEITEFAPNLAKKWMDNAEESYSFGVGGDLNAPLRTPEQEQRLRNTAKAAIPRVLTGIPETVNVVGQVIDAFQQPAVNADGSARDFSSRFADAKYGSDPAVAKEVVAKRIQMVEDRQKAGDKRDFEEIYKEVGDTPEFKQFEQPRIPVIRRYTDKAAEGIDNYFGAPTDDKKTTEEKVITGGLQALVPSNLIMKGAKNLPSVARWGLDMVMPGSTHYTPGGVLTNAGVSTAVITGMDAALGNENNPDIAAPDVPEVPEVVIDNIPAGKVMPATVPLPPARPALTRVSDTDDDYDTSELAQKLATTAHSNPTMVQLGMAGLSIGAIFGGRHAVQQAAAKSAAQVAADSAAAASKAAKKTGSFISGGPTHVKPDERAPGTATVFSETAPGYKLLNTLNKDKKETNAAVNSWAQWMRSHVTQAVEARRTAGRVEGMPEGVVSGRQMRLIQDKLMQSGEYEAFIDWKIKASVLERRGNDLKSAEKALSDNLVAMSAAHNNGNYKKLVKLQHEYNEINKKLQGIKNDEPDFRGPLKDESTDAIRAVVDAGNKKTHWAEINSKYLQKSEVDRLRFMVRNGLMDKKTAAKLRDLHKNHVFLQDDLHPTKSGLKRLSSKIGKRFTLNENPYGDNIEYMSSLMPTKSRKLPTDSPVNQPINPFDADDIAWENVIRFQNRNSFKRNVIADIEQAYHSALKAGRTEIAETVEQFSNNGLKEFTPEHIKALVKNNVLQPDEWVDVLDNGKIKFYKFPKDPYMTRMMKQGPTVTIPIARGMSRFWRTMTTGAGNAGFVERNLIMETKGFNALRPEGSLYGTDYLLHKGMQLTPKPFQEALAPFKAPVLGAVRTLTTAVDPPAYLMNLAQTVHLFAKQNDVWIARSIIEGLEMDEGFFATIAKNPKGRKFLEAVASNAHKSFEESLVSTLFNNRAVDLAVMRNMDVRKREVDSFFDTRMPRWARYLTSPAYFGIQQYRFMVNSMQEAARVGYAYRNAEMITDPLTGKVDPKLAKKLYADTRTVASGNLAKQAGSPWLQGVASAVPFSNIMMRSTQNLSERLRENPRVLGMFMTGVVGPKLYSTYLMSHWDRAAYEYQYYETPAWKRVQNIILPTPETVWKWMNGERVPFSKDAVWEIQLLPEFRPYAEAINQAAIGIGLFGAGQNDKLTGGVGVGSMLENMGMAMKDAFGPAPPPAASGLAAAGGAKVELGNVANIPAAMAGDSTAKWNPLDTSGAGSASTRTGDPVNLSSDLNKTFVNVISALGGTMIGRLSEAYDTGSQVYRDTGQLDEALWGATKELAQRTFESPEDIPLIRKGHDRVYRFNDVSAHAREMRQFISTVVGPGSVNKHTGNDVLDEIAVALRQTAKNGEYKTFADNYRKNDLRYKALNSLRTMDYNDREKEKSEIAREMNKDDQQQARFLNEMADELKKEHGEAYKKEFGEEFTLDRWAGRIRKAWNMSKREQGLDAWREDGKGPSRRN